MAPSQAQQCGDLDRNQSFGNASSAQRDAAFSYNCGVTPPEAGRSQTEAGRPPPIPQDRANTILAPPPSAYLPRPPPVRPRQRQANGYPPPRPTDGYGGQQLPIGQASLRGDRCCPKRRVCLSPLDWITVRTVSHSEWILMACQALRHVNSARLHSGPMRQVRQVPRLHWTATDFDLVP